MKGICTIRMDYVEGDCLEDIWSEMSDEDKISIARQLRHILSMMRASPPPEPLLIGSCGGPARSLGYIYSSTGVPFETESQFNDFLLQDLPKATIPAVRAALVQSLSAHSGQRIVFSHGDLSPRNIVVRDGKIKALLDWEYAGWYPAYWEYVKFVDCPTNCRDWYSLIGEIFEEQHPSELLTHQVIAPVAVPIDCKAIIQSVHLQRH